MIKPFFRFNPEGVPAGAAAPTGATPVTPAPAVFSVDQLGPLIDARMQAREAGLVDAIVGKIKPAEPAKPATEADRMAALEAENAAFREERKADKAAAVRANAGTQALAAISDRLPKSLKADFVEKITAKAIVKDGVLGVMGKEKVGNTEIEVFRTIAEETERVLAAHPDVTIVAKVTTGGLDARGSGKGGNMAPIPPKVTQAQLMNDPRLAARMLQEKPDQFNLIMFGDPPKE